MQGTEAGKLFNSALRAIMAAKKERRISDVIAADRISYLTSRFDSLLDPLQQIAACQAMIQICQRAEATVHVVTIP